VKLKSLLVLAAVAASSASFAGTCTSSFNLGTMGPPATKVFGNTFSGTRGFSDCYDFSINAAANAGGTTAEVNGTRSFLGFTIDTRLIDVLAVSLFHNDSGNTSKVDVTDFSPSSFSFANLTSGGYELVVTGVVGGFGGAASYNGTLTTQAIAGAVPEPATVALMGLALLGAGAAARRRSRG
jgi:hypothetical protein